MIKDNKCNVNNLFVGKKINEPNGTARESFDINDTYYTLNELCSLFKVSRNYLLTKIKENKLTAYKMGGRFVVTKRDFVKFMDGNRIN